MRCFQTAILFTALASAALAQHPRKRNVPSRLANGPNAVSQDVGDVAVLVDNGLMVTRQSRFDLAGTTVRFAPAGDHRYTVSSSAGVLDPAFGPELTFGYPGTPYPGDDDTQEVAFPAGFPFLGVTYDRVWVNIDGNVTFGLPDIESSPRDKARAALGAPRVCAFLHDWNPHNALNPAGGGTIHGVVKTNPDRLVVTWNGVADFEGGVASTFQLTLHATGVAEVTFVAIDTPELYGVVGVAEGGGRGPLQGVDFTAPQQSLAAGAILEAFAAFTFISEQEVAKEFYKAHADKFDFLVVMTDFTASGPFYSHGVRNQTHGIGNPSLYRGFPSNDTVYDFTAFYGSAGELEQFVFMNNVYLFWADEERKINPPIVPYSPDVNDILWPENLGRAVSLDGQAMSQVRIIGTMPRDGGEWSRLFAHGGAYGTRLFSPMVFMAHETGHRWSVMVQFVHPTKGVGFDSFDLLGRDTQHWSWFLNTSVPSAQFPDAPRSSVMEGNAIVDLGPVTSYQGRPVSLDPGERVFATPATQLVDGYSALDQHLMGLRRADEVGPFFYVDEPKSIYTGESLDVFDPDNPLNTAVTMRAWQPMGGIAFKGKRVDLTMADIQAFERQREGRENPHGRRFWGPRGNLRVRYFGDTRRVDPNGNASVTLSEAERELGDEADMIDASGNPVDVKTMAFILLVESGPPGSHPNAIDQVDGFRRAWQAFGNGPATGGRGRFDTVLNPAIH